jgi:subtilisin family serine protease
MPTRNVIVEYLADPELERQARSSVRSLDVAPLGHLLPAADAALDPGFAPVELPAADGATYILRGELDEAQIEALRAHEAVAGVFSDPLIQPCLTCIDSPPLGDDADVEELLRVADLRGCAMTGEGVMVAIVDGGINVAYLEEHGKSPTFSPDASWGYAVGVKPGSVVVGHGTMCAFDVCIAAPACTLVDTSAATPVVAGVLAAVRSKRPLDPADPATSPAAIRELLTSTARDLGAAGYDYEHGYGVVDGARLRDEVCDEPRPQPSGE